MSILFNETEINGMSVRNRFVRSATWEGMCPDEGRCTKELVEFTVDLARGGVGLIVMGHTYVMENGKASPRQTGIYRDDLIDSLRPIPDGVHEYGGKVKIGTTIWRAISDSDIQEGEMVRVIGTGDKNLVLEVQRVKS